MKKKIISLMLGASAMLSTQGQAMQEELFHPNEVGGKIQTLKCSKQYSPTQKVEELGKFFLKPFISKVLPLWQDREQTLQHEINDFVTRVLKSSNTFTKEEDVERPFKKNSALKKILIERTVEFIQKNKIAKEINEAQIQLTELWVPEHTTNLNLGRTIASLYIEEYLKGSEVKSDGYLMKEALRNIIKGTELNYTYLMQDRPYFPRGFTIKFDAKEMIQNLENSIYYSTEKNKGIINPEDINYLKKNSSQIDSIIKTLQESYDVPQELFNQWSKVMPDDWIENKLSIAQYVLKNK